LLGLGLGLRRLRHGKKLLVNELLTHDQAFVNFPLGFRKGSHETSSSGVETDISLIGNGNHGVDKVPELGFSFLERVDFHCVRGHTFLNAGVEGIGVFDRSREVAREGKGNVRASS